MNCSNCGQPATPDDVFCATCGADLAAQRAAAAAAPASVPVSAPPKKSRALTITLIVLGVLLLLCSCAGIGGYLLFMPIRSEIKEVITPEPSASDEATAVGGALSTASHATPEEAVKAELPADWVVKKVEDGAERVVFWAGPPNSEFTTIYVVEVQTDEKWRVTESSPLD